jgi:hypothetical protein
VRRRRRSVRRGRWPAGGARGSARDTKAATWGHP